MATPDNYSKDTYRVKAKGKEYVYAWRNGPRLPGEFGSPESLAAWLDATSRRKLGDAATVKGLIADFKASERWQGTAGRKSYAARTKVSYSFYIDKIEAEFGDMSLVGFERREVRELIAKWRKKTFANSPRDGDYAIAVLRLLLSFAIRLGRLGVNHAKAMESLYESDRASLIWEEAELAALEECVSLAIWRAANLASLTGLRQADLLRLRWDQIKPERIDLQTSKSRKRNRASVPMYDDLRAFLDTIPRVGPTVLVTHRGARPWGSGFGASWGKALAKIVKAHPELAERMKALHFHDLRGNAVTRFYIAGFKPHEIARFVGWKEAAVNELLDVYVSDKAVWAAHAKRLATPASADPANQNEGEFAKPLAKLS